MNEEEIKAIEYFKHKIKNKLPLEYEKTYVGGKPYRMDILQLETNFTEEQANKTQVILNLISKLQKELDKKDKVINLIINMILSYDIDEDICKQIGKLNCDKYKDGECEKCIKEYFYKKVEAENES